MIYTYLDICKHYHYFSMGTKLQISGNVPSRHCRKEGDVFFLCQIKRFLKGKTS